MKTIKEGCRSDFSDKLKVFLFAFIAFAFLFINSSASARVITARSCLNPNSAGFIVSPEFSGTRQFLTDAGSTVNLGETTSVTGNVGSLNLIRSESVLRVVFRTPASDNELVEGSIDFVSSALDRGVNNEGITFASFGYGPVAQSQSNTTSSTCSNRLELQDNDSPAVGLGSNPANSSIDVADFANVTPIVEDPINDPVNVGSISVNNGQNAIVFPSTALSINPNNSQYSIRITGRFAPNTLYEAFIALPVSDAFQTSVTVSITPNFSGNNDDDDSDGGDLEPLPEPTPITTLGNTCGGTEISNLAAAELEERVSITQLRRLALELELAEDVRSRKRRRRRIRNALRDIRTTLNNTNAHLRVSQAYLRCAIELITNNENLSDAVKTAANAAAQAAIDGDASAIADIASIDTANNSEARLALPAALRALANKIFDDGIANKRASARALGLELASGAAIADLGEDALNDSFVNAEDKNARILNGIIEAVNENRKRIIDRARRGDDQSAEVAARLLVSNILEALNEELSCYDTALEIARAEIRRATKTPEEIPETDDGGDDNSGGDDGSSGGDDNSGGDDGSSGGDDNSGGDDGSIGGGDDNSGGGDDTPTVEEPSRRERRLSSRSLGRINRGGRLTERQLTSFINRGNRILDTIDNGEFSNPRNIRGLSRLLNQFRSSSERALLRLGTTSIRNRDATRPTAALRRLINRIRERQGFAADFALNSRGAI